MPPLGGHILSSLQAQSLQALSPASGWGAIEGPGSPYLAINISVRPNRTFSLRNQTSSKPQSLLRTPENLAQPGTQASPKSRPARNPGQTRNPARSPASPKPQFLPENPGPKPRPSRNPGPEPQPRNPDQEPQAETQLGPKPQSSLGTPESPARNPGPEPRPGTQPRTPGRNPASP